MDYLNCTDLPLWAQILLHQENQGEQEKDTTTPPSDTAVPVAAAA